MLKIFGLKTTINVTDYFMSTFPIFVLAYTINKIMLFKHKE